MYCRSVPSCSGSTSLSLGRKGGGRQYYPRSRFTSVFSAGD